MSSTSASSTGSSTGSSNWSAASSASEMDRKADAVVRSLSLFGILPGMVVAVVVAILVHPLVGLVALVVVAAGWAVSVRVRARASLDRVLEVSGASPMSVEQCPRWANVVDGLGVTSGVNDAELWFLDVAEANAMAAAGQARSVLVVTRGLVEALSVVELEGVAANLLGRIKDGTARYGTITFGLLGGLLGTVEPAGKLVADGLGEQAAVRSDLVAVAMTRYPPGLAQALERLDELGTAVPTAPPSMAQLWVAPTPPDGAGVDPAIAGTVLQSLSYRAAVLREL